jgi:hypothetical protein
MNIQISDDSKKLYQQIANHISNNPELARPLEKFAAFIQGKGYGTASIKYEINAIRHLVTVEPKLAIDVGGNVGLYTEELRANKSDLIIHVF